MTAIIQTYSGGEFDALNPTPDMIRIIDIANSLSQTTRFRGHGRQFYSVAQHSVMCSGQAYSHTTDYITVAQWALLHDAAEAYLGDLPSPIKRVLPAFATMEDNILQVIAEKYGLPWPMPQEVKAIDQRMLVTERAVLLGTWTPAWEPWRDIKPYDHLQVIPWSVETSRVAFLEEFDQLFADDKEAC